MAEFFLKGKRKRAIAALSLALSATFTLSMLAACGGTTEDPTDGDEGTTSSATDTQLLRNGNFEFYSEMDEKLEDKRNFISTPTSWSFSSGSPSSNTRSGLILASEWDQLTKQGRELTTIADAYAHWNDENVTVYDRLKFFDLTTKTNVNGGIKEEYDALATGSDEKKFFADYKYSIDYEDVQYLAEEIGEKLELHEGVKTDDEGNPTETGVLMIHNRRSSDGVVGTAQYYTSSTTITLEAGVAAEISLWARTDKLYHYYSAGTDEEKDEIEKRGGAYVGIINTVGGTTLDEMQIKNINTHGEWQKYTVYVRANTYATTTFRIKLGLGQGTTSDNRYEAVDGYAFFDDVQVKKINNATYEEDTKDLLYGCDLNSKKDEKIFDMDDEKLTHADGTYEDKYYLDLLADGDYTDIAVNGDTVDVELSSETSGDNTYYSKIKDNRSDAKEGQGTETPAPADQQSVVGAMTYAELKTKANSNGYLKNIFADDFEGKFPFYTAGTTDVNESTSVIMLLSTNGAAYTATLTSAKFSVPAGERILVSFYTKTSSIRAGRTGASVTLVDGSNKTNISAFDSTTVSTVDIDTSDAELTDIYKGWVHCFFFVSNDTDDDKTFSLEFHYGPTSVAGTTADNYCEGYAAFANFETTTLTKTQYGYASTNSYAQKVELTAHAQNSAMFDNAEASSDIEHDLATPVSFKEALAGSKMFDQDGVENERPEGVYAGLLNQDYADNYKALDTAWATKLTSVSSAAGASDWWTGLFGDKNNPAYVARQPLVLMNVSGKDLPSYGYVSSTLKTTIAANSSRRITMHVKVAEGTTAYFYLLDTENTSKGFNNLLTPTIPLYTFWYDDDGNIVKGDPTDKDFDEKTDVLFYLEKNGLYTKAGESDGKYYANLYNFKKEEVAENSKTQNLLTEDDAIAYYGVKNEDGTFTYYAYREGNSEENYKYSQPVEFLPTEVDGESILRYTAPEDTKQYESAIAVEGTNGSWATISFYVRTGSKAKTYRLEFWAGERSNATDGFKNGGYIFLDDYKSEAVSNFDGLRSEAVDALLEKTENQDENDSEKLNGSLALYYTYSFFDSRSFLRHDRTLDEEDLGSRWGSYTQSTYSEGIVWLRYDDADGEMTRTGNPSYSLYVDYSIVDVTITPDQLSNDSDAPDTTPNNDNDEPVNVWLIVSSALLAVVTIFAVIAVAVQAIRKRTKKQGKGGNKKPSKAKTAKQQKPAPVAAPKAPAEEPADENSPYNE